MVVGLINANPVVYEKKERRSRQAPETTDENAAEAIDQLEIFDILSLFPYLHAVYLSFLLYLPLSGVLLPSKFFFCLHSLTFLHHIRDIKDPEHPYSLEELNVVTEDSVEINDELSHVR